MKRGSRAALHAGAGASLGILLLMWLPLSTGAPPLWEHADKLQHGLIYAGLCALWWWAGLSPSRAAVGVFAWSVLAECGQLLLPWRGFEWADLLANLAGAVVMAMLLQWLVLRPRATAG